MGFSLNGKDIKELYYGNIKISEAWLNGQKVYSSVPLVSGINYIFRDIDENGNLTLATGALEDASKITSIGDYGLYYAFRDCIGLTGSVSFPNLTSISDYGLNGAFNGCKGLTGSISFPNLISIGNNGLNSAFHSCTGLTEISFPSLTSIGAYGLTNAFNNCSGLTGSVSFPNLTSIGDYALGDAFYYCTGITEVHFKSSLSGNSECTASNMGCTNATVYFDL